MLLHFGGPEALAFSSWGKMRFMNRMARLRREDSILLVVDVQEKLLPHIWRHEELLKNCVLLVEAAQRLEVPVLAVEQNPRHLGRTAGPLREALGETNIESKLCFSACPTVAAQIAERPEAAIVLCGIEAHVCVLQTALDLLAAGRQVFVAGDAVSSRVPENRAVGWERMMAAGALPTSAESAVFEWLGQAGTDDFRALLPLLR
jgi:nicotinamidase-related amidase